MDILTFIASVFVFVVQSIVTIAFWLSACCGGVVLLGLPVVGIFLFVTRESRKARREAKAIASLAKFAQNNPEGYLEKYLFDTSIYIEGHGGDGRILIDTLFDKLELMSNPESYIELVLTGPLENLPPEQRGAFEQILIRVLEEKLETPVYKTDVMMEEVVEAYKRLRTDGLEEFLPIISGYIGNRFVFEQTDGQSDPLVVVPKSRVFRARTAGVQINRKPVDTRQPANTGSAVNQPLKIEDLKEPLPAGTSVHQSPLAGLIEPLPDGEALSDPTERKPLPKAQATGAKSNVKSKTLSKIVNRTTKNKAAAKKKHK